MLDYDILQYLINKILFIQIKYQTSDVCSYPNKEITKMVNTEQATFITTSATCFGHLGYIQGHICIRSNSIIIWDSCMWNRELLLGKQNYFSWFQAFAVFYILYTFFWVITRRLEFICRRFGTLSIPSSQAGRCE